MVNGELNNRVRCRAGKSIAIAIAAITKVIASSLIAIGIIRSDDYGVY